MYSAGCQKFGLVLELILTLNELNYYLISYLWWVYDYYESDFSPEFLLLLPRTNLQILELFLYKPIGLIPIHLQFIISNAGYEILFKCLKMIYRTCITFFLRYYT